MISTLDFHQLFNYIDSVNIELAILLLVLCAIGFGLDERKKKHPLTTESGE